MHIDDQENREATHGMYSYSCKEIEKLIAVAISALNLYIWRTYYSPVTPPQDDTTESDD